MKSLLLLWRRILDDSEIQCRASASLDYKAVQARVENEGLEFLTITLPAYGKAFERSLSEGQVSNAMFSISKRDRQHRGLPRLLGGFLCLIFDRYSGTLLHEPSIEAVHAVRMLTYAFSKILIPCSDVRVKAAIDGYMKCESQVLQASVLFEGQIVEDFRRVSTMLFGDVLAKMDKTIYEGNVVPKHGPGATADKLRNNAKYQQFEWTDRLEEIFPAGEFLLPNWRYHLNQASFTWLEPGAERPVKVITVPKTMKTPRIIAVEPTCMQYVQQGLMEIFVRYLESDSRISGMIGFTDQTPNQRMALEGSRDGSLATLDLSEASDRVSMRHVKVLLANTPWLAKAVEACRSSKADVPGYGIVPLSKFASMGSALTFPVEEAVFLTVVFLGIERELSYRLTKKDIESFKGRVRVYGDDIIVPTNFALSVSRTLELFGFKVNRDKSFWTGLFRESCGKEYFFGHDVSIPRVRRLLPQRRTDFQEIISAVSLRNQYYEAGYWRTANFIEDVVNGFIPFPTVSVDSPVLGRHSFLGYRLDRRRDRYDQYLQRPMVKVAKVQVRPPVSKLDGEGALLKYFLKRGLEPSADGNHLERQGRPESVGIKLGWACPF